MIDKNSFIKFLGDHFKSKEIKVQHFDSGCSMLDIYLNDRGMICVQTEPLQIGVSKINDYPNYFDLSAISDNIFYSNVDAEAYVLAMLP